MPSVVKDLNELLRDSAATDEFKQAVQSGKPSDHIRASRGLPPVKVLRLISKLLEEQPTLEIRTVDIEGHSGCSDFEGKLVVNGTDTFEFRWCCAWRAEQEGFKDFWGQPDQIRAAREFGYQCFEYFRPA